MKINRSVLSKMIQESIKRHLLSEWGDTWNYPGDSDFRSDAPWNRVDPETETEEKNETFPTVPLILLGIKDYVSDEGSCLNLTRIGLAGCPETIDVSAEYEYEMKDDGPDEDGLSCWYRDNEERNWLGIYVNVNSKWCSFIDWAQQTYAEANPQLFEWLKDAYDGLLDMLNDYTYTADEFDKTMENLKSEVSQMETLMQQINNAQ